MCFQGVVECSSQLIDVSLIPLAGQSHVMGAIVVIAVCGVLCLLGMILFVR